MKINRNILYVVFSQVVKVVLNGSAFFILARQLGPTDFGVFVSLSALMSMVAPLADMGLYHVNVKKYSEEEGVGGLIGGSFQTVLIMGMILIPLMSFVALLVFGGNLLVIFFICFEILFLEKVFPLLNSVFSCKSEFGKYSGVEILQAVFRFFAACSLVLVGGKIEEWSAIFLIQGAILFLFFLFWIVKNYGLVFCGFSAVRDRICVGAGFVVSTVCETSVQELDRVLVGKLAGPVVAGVYGVVMRINNFIMIPIGAYFFTIYRDYFVHDSSPDGGVWKKTARAIFISTGLAAFLSLVVLVAAPIFVFLLGDEYSSVLNSLYLSAFLPIAYTLTQPMLDGMSGRGMQKARIFVVLGFLVLNVLMMIILVPKYSTLGALVALIGSRLALIIPCFLILKVKHERC